MPSRTTASEFYYYCIVTNSNGCIATSSPSGSVKVIATPTITTNGVINTVTAGTTSATLPYTATTSSPTSYSIDWDTIAENNNLVDQPNTVFSFAAGGGNLTGIVIPATVNTGITYNGVMTIRNATGCTTTKAVTFSILNVLDVLGLNSTTPAASAYALRKLSTAYAGPLVRVNISGTFYDVYPDTNGKFSLDSKISSVVTPFNAAIAVAGTNSLSSIVTVTTNATVAIWYDQSGWGRTLTNGTTASQPTIISAGAIRMKANGPTLFFDATDDGLTSSAAAYMNATPLSVNLVAGSNSSSTAHGEMGTL